MQKGVAHDPGHVRIHFGDDQFRLNGCFPCVIGRNAKTHVAVRIGWRYHDECSIRTQGTVPEHSWNLIEKTGNIIGPSFRDGQPCRTSRKQGHMPEGIPVAWRTVGAFPHGNHVDDRNIAQLRRSFDQRREKGFRRCTGMPCNQLASRMDVADSFFRRNSM